MCTMYLHSILWLHVTFISLFIYVNKVVSRYKLTMSCVHGKLRDQELPGLCLAYDNQV